MASDLKCWLCGDPSYVTVAGAQWCLEHEGLSDQSDTDPETLLDIATSRFHDQLMARAPDDVRELIHRNKVLGRLRALY